MAQYQEDLAKGRVDSMSFSSFLYARARGATSGVYQFLGLKGIEDAHAEYTAMKKELLELAVHDLQAEAALAADRKRSEERAARAAVEKAAAEKAAAEGEPAGQAARPASQARRSARARARERRCLGDAESRPHVLDRRDHAAGRRGPGDRAPAHPLHRQLQQDQRQFPLVRLVRR